jgi:short-subunit dehydrogenase
VAPRPDLSGKTALVTGATGGLGNAIARALHARGATVRLSGRRAEVLEELRAELGERAEIVPADLVDAGEVARLADASHDVDVLVANAALPGSGRFAEYTTEEVDRALAVNLRAPMELTRALLPHMLERDSGHLVYIASVSGKVAVGGSSVYSATKFGLRGFAFALHDELRRTGVGVTTVFPGFIRDAGMYAETKAKLPPGMGTRTPDQVAEAVLTGIATNRPEITDAAVPQRVGGLVAGASPRLVAAVTRLSGGESVAEKMADAQRDKR